MQERRILVIEDSVEMFEFISRSINSGHTFVSAGTLEIASKIIRSEPFDLILLDVQLPDGDGYHFASLIRNIENFDKIPILFLTARSEVMDTVIAFTSGGDDFIKKPFEPDELSARVNSFLRKSHKAKVDQDVLKSGPITIDIFGQRVSIVEDEKTRVLDLTSIEFRLLTLLAKNEGKEMSRDQILDSIWGENVNVYLRSVDTHISKLRMKLGTCSVFIRSAHGRGYIFGLS